jgi:phage shock protein A
VEAQREIQSTASTMSDQSAIATFQRMEEKIADMERQASAAVELASELSHVSLEAQFRALEQHGAADARLVALKQKLGLPPGSAPGRKELAAGTAVADAVVVDRTKDRA